MFRLRRLGRIAPSIGKQVQKGEDPMRTEAMAASEQQLTAQQITEFEECIGTVLRALIDLMTKLFEYVKVHRVSVLCLVFFDAKNITASGSFWQARAAF